MLVIVRGGGDLATGIIYRLHKAHIQVLVLEKEHPSAIRRNVAFSEAIYEGKQTVQGVTCYRAESLEEAMNLLNEGKLAILIDSEGNAIRELKPDVVIDAIIAKKNLGTTMDMAELVIGVGPGFTAGKDVHSVIETKRGHNLGRVLSEGTAFPNSGIPGNIGGFTKERVIHSPAEGKVRNVISIGDKVKKGDLISIIEPCGVKVNATIDGIVRGLIRDGFVVTKGFKMADIDPRIEEYDNCFTISDKASAIAGGVMEAIFTHYDLFR